MKPFSPLHSIAGALLLMALAPAARADASFCLTQPSYFTGPFYYCADSASNAGSSENVAMPDGIGTTPVLAQSGGSVHGGGSLEYGYAGPGVLRGYVMAEVLGAPPPSPPYDHAAGFANARLFDSGLIDSGTSGLAVGTVVSALVTMTVEGAFTNDGEATTSASFYDNFNPLRQDVRNIADKLQSASTITFVLGGLVIGDSLALDYLLNVQAGAGNDPPGTMTMGLADASNTALLHLDFLTPGVFFDAASGFDYATGAVVTPPPPPSGVPEPSILLLGAIGLTAIGLRRWRS